MLEDSIKYSFCDIVDGHNLSDGEKRHIDKINEIANTMVQGAYFTTFNTINVNDAIDRFETGFTTIGDDEHFCAFVCLTLKNGTTLDEYFDKDNYEVKVRRSYDTVHVMVTHKGRKNAETD
jgi:hypothetical protein